MIEILRAPTHLVIQDLGFTGFRKIGVPRAGAMDSSALIAGNSLVGNAPTDPGFEWSLSGGTLTFTGDASIALTGAVAHGRLGPNVVAMNTRIEVKAGTTLEIDRFVSGRFLYLCVSPPPDIEPVFGSRSTYLPGGIGGFQGRRLKNGDRVALAGHATLGESAAFVKTHSQRSRLRIIPGPQGDVLDGRLLTYLLESEFTVSRSSDRTGYKLAGPAVETAGLPQILSEPACEGAIQLTDAGTPIVLMADGPTIGGYNKIAVVLAEDLPALAQKTPGERVRFALSRS